MLEQYVVADHPLLEQMDTPLTRWFDATIRRRTRELAQQREGYCRELLHARLPRPLHWLIDRPKLLKRLLRFVPRWQPSLIFVDLRRMYGVTSTASAGMTAEIATHLSKVALHRAVEDGAGFVFTYADPTGLPAEVYGPVK